MNDDRTFERRLADRMEAERGSAQLPDSFYDEFRRRADGTRQRRRWLALIKEPPMRTSSTLAVGSPMARVAAIVVATLLLAATVAGAGIAGSRLLAADGTIVVDQSGNGTTTTITQAVEVAEDGDTILVRPGTYPESIAIDKDITLQGDGERGSVLVQFTADGPTYAEGGPGGEPFGYGILLDGSDARVSNLTIQGPADLTFQPVSGVYVVGGDPIVEDVDIILSGDRWNYAGGSYYRRSAFRITGGSTATIRGSTWDGYVRIFGESNAPTFEGNTITAHEVSIAEGGHQPVLRGNTLLEGAALLWQDPGSGGIAEDNDITGSIGIREDTDPVVRGNRIRQGATTGAGRLSRAAIDIADGATPLIERNVIDDSAIGILVTGSGTMPEIQGNSLHGSTVSAVIVMSGATAMIADNMIEDNTVGITVAEPSTPTLGGNTFCGNDQDLDVPEGSSLSLDGNTVCEM